MSKIFRVTSHFCATVIFALLCVDTASAQCSVTYTYQGMYTMGGMDVNFIQKYLSTSESCSLTMSASVIDCNPDPSASGVTLSATAYAGATMALCAWNCGCGTVQIDGPNDGLPIELLEFQVDEGSQ